MYYVNNSDHFAAKKNYQKVVEKQALWRCNKHFQ